MNWWKIAEVSYLIGASLIIILGLVMITVDNVNGHANAANVEAPAISETLENGAFLGLSEGVTEVFSEDSDTPVDSEEVSDITVDEVVGPAPVFQRYFDVGLDEELQDHIFTLCEAHGIDPAIVIAMIWKESNFNPDNVGDNGDSRGLMQIQSKWHHELMEKLGCEDLFDPYQNVTVGINIFAGHLNKGRGVEYALMAYNGGASYARRKMEAGEVSYYARKVLEKAASLETYTIEIIPESTPKS